MWKRKKQPSLMEQIALDMYMPPGGRFVKREDIVPELQIISKITFLPDLEERDRDGRTLLINAAFYSRIQVMKYLLNRGGNVNAQDHQGFTALHAAVMENNLESVQLLLEAGADVHIRDGWGNNVLNRVKHTSNVEIIRLLVEKGADPMCKNDYGVAPKERLAAYPEVLAAMGIQ